MLSVPILINPLKGNILRSTVASSALESTEGILLLDDETPLSDRHVFIGTPETVARAVRRLPANGTVTLISAGDCPELLAFGDEGRINLFVISLDLVTLFNTVQKQLTKYLKWEKELKDIVTSDSGIQKLAEKGFEMLQTPVTILNMGFKVLGGFVPEGFNDPILHEMKINGFLSYNSVVSLVNEETQTQSPFAPQIEYVSKRTGNRIIISRIFYNGNLIARVLVTLSGADKSEYSSLLAADLGEYVQAYFLSTKASQYITNTEIGAFVSDLIELRLTDPEELEHRLKLIPAMSVEKYYHTLVMSFEERTKAIPWNYVVSQLEQIFPNSCITVYKNDVVIIAKKQRHNSAPQFDLDKLMEILKLYDAYIAVGNYSKFLTSLRPIYLQTKDTIRLGRSFRKDKEERIFYYEEYSVYHTIDMCADVNSYHRGNLVYLCHPGLISIERYDKKYGTNLRDTLYVYLTNDCNTVKASKLMYVHRNTMYYKINKIEELIGQSLEDGMLKERLLFSFHVLEYAEKYMKEDPLILKRRFDDRII